MLGLEAVDSLHDIITRNYSLDPTAPSDSSNGRFERHTDCQLPPQRWSTRGPDSGLGRSTPAPVPASVSAYLYRKGAKDGGSAPPNSALIIMHGGVAAPSIRFRLLRLGWPGGDQCSAYQCEQTDKPCGFQNADGCNAVQVVNRRCFSDDGQNTVWRSASAFMSSSWFLQDAMDG